MRCPKCSFISFDLVESCTKCGKNISKASEELKGTTADVDLPAFLNPDFNRYEAEEAEGARETAGGEAVVDLDITEEEESVDFALEEETATDEELDFAVEEEVAVEGETEEKAGEEALDISDLGPGEELAEEPIEDELAFETEDVEVAVPAEEHEAGELEDLEVEGIDLQGSSTPKSGRVMPSVKTGTALDDFDIDLGDLISPKKEGGSK